MSEECRLCRAVVALRAHSPVHFDQAVEGQEAQIVVVFHEIGEHCPCADQWRGVADAIGGPEQDQLGALAVAQQQNEFAGTCILKREGQRK